MTKMRPEIKSESDIELLKKMLSVPCFFTFDLEGKGIEVKPGRFSSMYINLKTIWSRPDILFPVAERLADLCHGCDCVIGIESGGSPYAALVAKELGINLVLARKEEKKQGEGYLAGDILDGEKIAVIDDVVATFKSSEVGFLSVKNSKNKVRIVSVISYGMDELIAKKYDLEITSLYYIDDIINLMQSDLKNKLMAHANVYREQLRAKILSNDIQS